MALKFIGFYKMKRQQIFYLIFKSNKQNSFKCECYIAALNLGQTFLQTVQTKYHYLVQTLWSKLQLSARKYRYLHTLMCLIKGYTRLFNVPGFSYKKSYLVPNCWIYEYYVVFIYFQAAVSALCWLSQFCTLKKN